MDELADAGALTARGRRALVLITLAVVLLAGSGLVYLRPMLTGRGPAPPLSLPGKGTVASFRFFDQDSGWAVLTGPLPSSAPSSILRTTDGGRHWTLVNVPDAATYSLTRFFDSRRAVVSVNTSMGQILYATEDGGIHWKSSDLPSLGNAGIASLLFVDPRRGWCLYIVPGTGGSPALLWRTLDGGGTWSRLQDLNTSRPSAVNLNYDGFRTALSFSDERHGTLMSWGNDALYLTQDGGLTWEARSLPQVPEAIASQASRGLSQRLVHLPDLLVDLVRVYATDAPYPTAIGYTRISADGGSTWSALRPLPGGPSLFPGVPEFQDSKHWLLAEGRRLWRTSDGGQTWEPRAPQLPASISISNVQLAAGGLMWAVGGDGAKPDRLFRSRDGGSHWEDQGAPSLQLSR
jgi:photosystem II stability/assembly factor-like uncharacterized protein